MRLGRILAPVIFAAVCACARGGEREFFPIGLYGVNDPKRLAVLRRDGFNAVQSYLEEPAELAALSNAARESGLKLLLKPDRLIHSTFSAAGFPVIAWYMADEPDVHGTPPGMLARLESRVKAWSSGAKTAFVVGNGHAAGNYAGSGDYMMVDWYPVPHLPLESAGEHVRLTVEAAGEKPVWAVLQAMDWRDYPQRDPKKPRIGRFPDMAEVRFMSYDAILHHARGVWYFIFTDPLGRVLTETPERWFALTTVTRELAALRPILERGRRMPLPFPPDPDGIQGRAWRYRGRDYVVIVNRRKGGALKVPEELLREDWRPLFEARRDLRELLPKNGDTWYLPPYRVMVLESRFRWSLF